jgi:hypothetical protein
MIVSHRHKFIFLKTRKTAGTSIEIALSQLCGPKDIITPLDPEDEETRRSRGGLGPQNRAIPFRRMTKAEWAKLIKQGKRKRLRHHDGAERIKRSVGSSVWNEYFKFCFERNPFDRAVSRYYWELRDQQGAWPSIAEFLEELEPYKISNWDIYTINDRIAVDYVGQYANLSEELRTIAEHIGLQEVPELPRAKGTYRRDKRHYSELLDGRARRRIEEVCHMEIETFGYRFETQENDTT